MNASDLLSWGYFLVSVLMVLAASAFMPGDVSKETTAFFLLGGAMLTVLWAIFIQIAKDKS